MFPRLITSALVLPRSAAAFAGRRAARPSMGAVSMLGSRAMSTDPASKITNPDMFCRQCEQTKDQTACTTVGICGKTAETAAIQDTLMYTVKSLSLWAVAAREAGATAEQLHEANVWTLRSVFATLTNVNFSESRIEEFCNDGMAHKKNLEGLVSKLGGTAPTGEVAELDLTGMSGEQMETFGVSVSIPELQKKVDNADCFSLMEIATYGAKGACAYAAHGYQLGKMDDEVMTGLHEVFAKLASSEADMNGLLANALRVGAINAQVLALLDNAHADNYGEPVPTPVKMTATAGKAILISGHDMVDIDALLKQTEGTGVNVYTHGEMLPAHGYPKLKAYPHLVGNYGTAWQNQKFEFAGFPGPVIVTTNCIIEPRRVYKDRLYTMNEVGYDGVKHIGEDRDFSEIIAQAQTMKGFPNTVDPATYHTVGFNHRAVLPLAGEVIEAAKSGALSRIVLIGGCDGSQWDRK
jgi:hydroxylamine reductase